MTIISAANRPPITPPAIAPAEPPPPSLLLVSEEPMKVNFIYNTITTLKHYGSLLTQNISTLQYRPVVMSSYYLMHNNSSY